MDTTSGADRGIATSVLVAAPRIRMALTVAGPAVVLAIAWMTSSLTDATEVANIALVLAIVTVVVAMTTVLGGVLTSVVGALSLNYFHTEPVHSLRITEGADITSVVLLLVLGLAVSAVTAVRLRSVARERHVAVADGARRVLQGDSTARPAIDMWADLVAACGAELALVSCRVATTADEALPRISLHRVRVDENSTFVLPVTGAVVELPDPRLGVHLVLTPQAGAGALELDRRIVGAFVEQAGLVMSQPVG